MSAPNGLATPPGAPSNSPTFPLFMTASATATRTAAAAPPRRYTRTAMLLHWVLGLALIGLFGVGIYMTGLPFSPQRLKLYNWHKWAGVTILVLSVLRLLWRATHRPPALPPAIENAMPGWQKLAHHATHGLLYTLFFAVPLIGWAYSSAAGCRVDETPLSRVYGGATHRPPDHGSGFHFLSFERSFLHEPVFPPVSHPPGGRRSL